MPGPLTFLHGPGQNAWFWDLQVRAQVAEALAARDAERLAAAQAHAAGAADKEQVAALKEQLAAALEGAKAAKGQLKVRIGGHSIAIQVSRPTTLACKARRPHY